MAREDAGIAKPGQHLWIWCSTSRELTSTSLDLTSASPCLTSNSTSPNLNLNLTWFQINYSRFYLNLTLLKILSLNLNLFDLNLTWHGEAEGKALIHHTVFISTENGKNQPASGKSLILRWSGFKSGNVKQIQNFTARNIWDWKVPGVAESEEGDEDCEEEQAKPKPSQIQLTGIHLVRV